MISNARLYTFVDTAYLGGRDPAEVARALCGGGSDLVQLRAKGLSLDAVRRMAERVHAVTHAASVPLVLNDHWELACELGLELCHLGQEDFFDQGFIRASELPCPGQTRKPPALGLSTHAPAQAERAVAAEPAYVAIGPVFATGTKPTARPVTLDYVRWAAANVALPWFAIGGINRQTLEAVLEAGARRICVVSAILNAPSIEAECLWYRAQLDAASAVH